VVTRRCASFRVRGGKARVARGGAASGPECAGDRQPVRILCGIGCHRVHQGAYRIVHAEVAVDLLDHPSGVFDLSTTPGPRWWVLSSSNGVSVSHRCEYTRANSAAGAASGSVIVVSSRYVVGSTEDTGSPSSPITSRVYSITRTAMPSVRFRRAFVPGYTWDAKDPSG